MTITDARRAGAAVQGDGRRPVRVGPTAWVAVGAFAVLVATFWVWWPAGVVLGLVAGLIATVRIAQRMPAPEGDASGDPFTDDEDLLQEVRRLRVRAGDDWAAFVDAAVLVTRQQTASTVGLQRGLGVPHGQAQHLLGLLEREGFVGPPRGTAARQVRVAPDRADDLRELLGV